MKPFTHKTYRQYEEIIYCTKLLEQVKMYLSVIESKTIMENELRETSPEYMWNSYDDLLHQLLEMETNNSSIKEYVNSYNCYTEAIC